MKLGPFPEATGYHQAVSLDRVDPLATYRDRFVIVDPDLIYLDGNSLGRLPKAASSIVGDAVDTQWGERLITSWNDGWWELQLMLGDQIAPLVGALPGEVIVSDSTSVNLYKLAMAALGALSNRGTIVTDDLNFPTDLYIFQGIAERFDRSLRVVESDGMNGPVGSILDAINSDTALVSLSHTAFKSGYTYDLAAITSAAHDAGAMVLWDCSHSVGVVPIDFAAAHVDLAVGCTYKYLNGGPGAPAWLYVRSDLQEQLNNPITAWWGHAAPFSFDLNFNAVTGIRKFHTGTMPILSLTAIEAGVQGVLEAGIGPIREKSVRLSEYLIGQVELHLSGLGFEVASPSDPEDRGSHVSLAHPQAWPVTRALVETAQVYPDFRTPDNIRLGLAPLYNSFIEVHTAVQRIRHVVESGLFAEFEQTSAVVT